MSLFAQQRWDEWIDLWADDGGFEFPYAPAGRHSRYVRKPDILAYMTPLAEKMKVEKVEYQKIYPVLDPKMACMELGIRAHIVKSGGPLNQKYVSMFETQAGKLGAIGSIRSSRSTRTAVAMPGRTHSVLLKEKMPQHEQLGACDRCNG